MSTFEVREVGHDSWENIEAKDHERAAKWYVETMVKPEWGSEVEVEVREKGSSDNEIKSFVADIY